MVALGQLYLSVRISDWPEKWKVEEKNSVETMKEEDLALARILVQESENESPTPLRKVTVQKKVFR